MGIKKSTGRIMGAGMALAIAAAPATRAAADSGLVGGLVGGLVSGIIVNEASKNRQPTVVRRSYVRVGPSSYQREQNREVQVALNYFGFPAGSPDGIVGSGTRSAISQYQTHMGYGPTGQLSDYERSFLVTSYQRALAGGALTQQQIAANGQGPRGLLLAYRDEAAGVPQAAPQQVYAPAPEPEVAPAVPQVMALTPEPEPSAPAVPSFAGPALPSFLGGDQSVQASLASHCNKVSLLTNTNGGYMTVASMTDPSVALGEQFCLARTYAIAQGEDMAAKVQGFTPQEIAAQCATFGPALKDQVAELSLKPEAEVTQSVSSFILTTGMAPAQLEATAKICLSVGYRTDNMDVAIGSALLLTTLGDKVYAELLGHHLAQGFGVSKRPDLALAWYDTALDALDNGTPAVFVPGQPGRADVIRKAAYRVGGRSEKADAGLPAFASQPDAAPTLPRFGN